MTTAKGEAASLRRARLLREHHEYLDALRERGLQPGKPCSARWKGSGGWRHAVVTCCVPNHHRWGEGDVVVQTARHTYRQLDFKDVRPR